MLCDYKLLFSNVVVISNSWKIYWIVFYNIFCFCILYCSLDELFDGGLYIGELVEIVGFVGVGKF